MYIEWWAAVTLVLNHTIPGPGAQVQVNYLWNVRDFWSWLAPGYHENRDAALSGAAFVSYENLSQYRHFKLQLDHKAQPGRQVAVGLWAKQFLTDTKWDYKGTVTTPELYKRVVGDVEPSAAPPSASPSEQKERAESKAVAAFRKVMNGPYQEQFNAERMADSLALVQHRFDHFEDREANVKPEQQMLPRQLAVYLSNRQRECEGLVGVQGGIGAEGGAPDEPVHADEGIPAALLPPKKKPVQMRQRLHALKQVLRLRTSKDVPVRQVGGRTPQQSLEAFRTRKVRLGQFVATPAAHGKLDNIAKNLPKRLWLWKILRILKPGEQMPKNTIRLKTCVETTYEAQLWTSKVENPGDYPVGSLVPCWEKVPKGFFLRTPQEKALRRQRKEAGEEPSPHHKSKDKKDNKKKKKKKKKDSDKGKQDKKDKKRKAESESEAAAASASSEEKAEDAVARPKRKRNEFTDHLKFTTRKPITGYLRTDNLIGGSFTLTTTCRIPTFVLAKLKTLATRDG